MRIIFFLILLGLLFFGLYNFSSVFQKTLAVAKPVLTKLDYYITSFSFKNYTKVVIKFMKDFNFTCIENIKINNKTVRYDFKKIHEDTLEINIYKKLYGVNIIEVDFCDGKIKDVIIVT